MKQGMSLRIGSSLFLLGFGLLAGSSVIMAEENLSDGEKPKREIMIINRAEQEAQPFLTGVFKVPEK